MTRESDVVIIGGGIAGMSLAARLAPMMAVTLLEKENALGYHSTSRSAAMYIPNYGTPIMRQLILKSGDDLTGDTIVEGGVTSPRGELAIVGADDEDILSTYMDGSTGLSMITPAEAHALCPILRKDEFVSAVYDHNAADIDVDALFQGFTRMARQAGANIMTGQEVLSICRSGSKSGKQWVIKTNTGNFASGVIVNAAGAWAGELASMAGASPISITPCRRSAAIIPLAEGLDPSPWPMIASIAETWYAKPDAGRLMVSPADQDPVAPCDAWVDDIVLAEGIDRFERATTVSVTRVEHQWAGLRSFTTDHEPVVGFDTKAQGFFWLAGQGGNGIQTSPALSQLAADMIISITDGEASKNADLISGLSPSRFNENC